MSNLSNNQINREERLGSLKAWHDDESSTGSLPKNSLRDDDGTDVIPFQLDDGVNDGEEIRRRRQYSSGSGASYSSEDEKEEIANHHHRSHGDGKRSKQPERSSTDRARNNTSSSRNGSRNSSSLCGRKQRQENEWERAERDEKECSDESSSSSSDEEEEDPKRTVVALAKQQQHRKSSYKETKNNDDETNDCPEMRSRSNTPSQPSCPRGQPQPSFSSTSFKVPQREGPEPESKSKRGTGSGLNDDSIKENFAKDSSPSEESHQKHLEQEEDEEASKKRQQQEEQQEHLPILDLSSLSKLAIYPGSEKKLIQGHIIRTKHLLSPQYHFYIENQLILLAEKKCKNRTSNYHFFDMTRTMKGDTTLTKKSLNYLGKLRSSNSKRKNILISNQMHQKAELGAMIFSGNTDPTEPRRVILILPPLHPSTKEIEPVFVNKHQQKQHFSTLLSMFKSLSTTSTTTTTRNSSKLKIFVNKEPEFENGFYRLNFDGRVSMASVKNFQVVEAEVEEALENLSKKKTNKTTKNNKKKKNETTTMDTGSTTQKKDAKVLLQFGKVNENKFHLDFTAPITPIQAFGVAIAQFNL